MKFTPLISGALIWIKRALWLGARSTDAVGRCKCPSTSYERASCSWNKRQKPNDT